MGIKGGHPLSGVASFPSDLADRLQQISVSTAEEFLSQSAVDAEPIQKYLGVDSQQFERLIEVAESVVPRRTLEEIREFQPKERVYGARSPHSEEFDSYRPARRSEG